MKNLLEINVDGLIVSDFIKQKVHPAVELQGERE
jgi:hypothetical protein